MKKYILSGVLMLASSACVVLADAPVPHESTKATENVVSWDPSTDLTGPFPIKSHEIRCLERAYAEFRHQHLIAVGLHVSKIEIRSIEGQVEDESLRYPSGTLKATLTYDWAPYIPPRPATVDTVCYFMTPNKAK